MLRKEMPGTGNDGVIPARGKVFFEPGLFPELQKILNASEQLRASKFIGMERAVEKLRQEYPEMQGMVLLFPKMALSMLEREEVDPARSVPHMLQVYVVYDKGKIPQDKRKFILNPDGRRRMKEVLREETGQDISLEGKITEEDITVYEKAGKWLNWTAQNSPDLNHFLFYGPDEQLRRKILIHLNHLPPE